MIYKIVKIIDEYNVVINAGTSNYIREGDRFQVYEPGIEITDPDTGALLGTLDFIKAKLSIKDVYPKMSVCENEDGEIEKALTDTLLTYTKRIPLNVDSKDISGGFENHSKKIRVGDLVRKV